MVHLSGLGLSSELMVLGLGGSLIEDQDGWLVVRTPSNPGFWWGNFLVLPQPVQPGQGEAWLERFAEAFPDATHRTFAVDSATGEAGDPGELAGMGVEVNNDTVLTAPVAGLAAPSPSARRAATFRVLAGDEDWAQALTLRVASDDMTMTPDHHAYLTRKVAAEHAGAELGAHTLVIMADPGYHAIDLYRSAGFTDAEVHVQLQQPAP